MPDLSRPPESVARRHVFRPASVGAAACCVIALAACAAPPARMASGPGGRYWDPRLGVYASPRLVADGEAVPRGGGGYLVGRPYTIGGRAYYPSDHPDGYVAVGTASWYGDAFHGRRTANGEIFDKNSISAAHPTLPLPSYVRVTNTGNGRSIIVRVNDRGPYHGGRVMDVSQRVAEALAFRLQGTARIKVEYMGRAGLGGSDDEKLLATLRVDGGPAQLDGTSPAPTMVASDEPPAAPAPQPPPFRQPAQAQRLARAEEGDMASDGFDASPPRRRFAIPAPPERPYDFGRGTALALPPRRADAARAAPPHLVSFAVSEPDARSYPRSILPPRRQPAWPAGEAEN